MAITMTLRRPLRCFRRTWSCWVTLICCITISMRFIADQTWYKGNKYETNKMSKNLKEIVHGIVSGLERTSNEVKGQGIEFLSVTDVFKPEVKGFHPDHEVTWCTHCSPNHLHLLHRLATIWDGPISVSVFAHGPHIQQTLTLMAKLHFCHQNIKRKVSFHLSVPVEDAQRFIRNVTVEEITALTCGESIQYHHTAKNFDNKGQSYPENVLRNIAVKHSTTRHITNIDIDIMPSKNLYRQLSKFFKSISPYNQTENTAYVLPCFETNAKISSGMTKPELIAKFATGSVRPFYNTVCPNCQNETDFERWKSLTVGTDLNVAYTKDWVVNWEPFVVGKKNALPTFDPRFRQFGFDRRSQMCEIHMRGFKLAVLDNGFLLHDGFKEKNLLHKNWKSENDKNLKLYKTFAKELQTRYPNSGRHC